jgi:transcriptional regulator with XRE-family HTH domain
MFLCFFIAFLRQAYILIGTKEVFFMNERAARIKKLIEGSGKSYRELEEITGVTRSTLQRYATGTTSKIPMDVVQKLEEAFGVPRGYIMGWDEKPAEELQGMGALAAQLVMDQEAMEIARDIMALGEADRFALRLVISSMKQKTTGAGASVVETEKCTEKADCNM